MKPDTETSHESKDGPTNIMAQNESKIADPSGEPLSIEARLAEEVRLRQFTEEVLDTRQEELEAHEAETKRLTKKLEALQRELQETQAQLAQAHNQHKSKAKELQDAKDQIFRLQPRRRDITESEAQEAYKKLCGNVQRWVENRLPQTLDDMEAGRMRGRPSPALATRYVSLLREPAKRCLNSSEADEYHTIAVIMNYLWLVFFSKSFYCSLDDSDGDATLAWIDEMEAMMSKLPRDINHCREWRSETLAALTSHPTFKVRRISYISLISEDLASLLAIVMPRIPPSELQSSLRRTVIEPAADLAHNLHLAPNAFSLKWPARSAWSRLEVYECLNLANGGMVLDPNSASTSSPARRKVSYLFDIAPGLFVERMDSNKRVYIKSICRPTVLVFAGDGDIAPSASVTKWLCDHSNGLQVPPRENIPKNSTHKSKILTSGRHSKL